MKPRLPIKTPPAIADKGAAVPMAFHEFQLVRSAGLGSRAIGYFSGSYYSHVDIVWPDGRLYGARSDTHEVAGVLYPAGVQFRPQGYERWSKVTRLAVPCTPAQKQRGLDWALKQERDPYDWFAIVAFAIDRDWRTEGAWFCSELATRYLEVAQDFELLITPNKIPPGTFGCIASARPGARITELDPKTLLAYAA